MYCATCVASILVGVAIGILAMRPYSRMATRQSEYIMAVGHADAYSSIGAALGLPRGFSDSDAIKRVREKEAIDALYLAAMSRGDVSDEELRRIGCSDGTIS